MTMGWTTLPPYQRLEKKKRKEKKEKKNDKSTKTQPQAKPDANELELSDLCTV